MNKKNKVRIVKVSPLELSPMLFWKITSALQITLKDFTLCIDEKEHIMYLNKDRKIPKKDIDGFMRVIDFPYPYVADDECGEGIFLDYVCEKYGYAAYFALVDYHKEMIKDREKSRAELLSKELTSTIEEELDRMDINEMVLYFMDRTGRDSGRKTLYNMVDHSCECIFALGYLVGNGRINPKDIVSHRDEREVFNA